MTAANTLDDVRVGNSYAALPPSFHAHVQPQGLTQPRLLHVNRDVAALLGFSEEMLHRPEFLELCSGARPLPGGETISTAYSGHQFGVWAGQLGDGRAHILGEVLSESGVWELQLKGSGRTPYSRMGDGRAVVRSSVREYLACAAMDGLGIPTTRALSLVVAEDPVYRETVEKAAVICRVAPSFVRFGTFEHWWNEPDNNRVLLDYVIDRYYPECRAGAAGPDEAALRFVGAVASRTAELVAAWQTVGFCHGVMNTDNMSVLGITLDYGPYGFMDGFQADHICNHTDAQGRYAWNAQPAVANWNLYRFANSLVATGLDPEELKTQLSGFQAAFLNAYHARLADKFGLVQWSEDDQSLVNDWWRLLHDQQADFTLSFRRLAQAPSDPGPFLDLFRQPEAARTWLEAYQRRLEADGQPASDRIRRMNAVNPLYVLRNHLAEIAIRGAQEGDPTEIETLLSLLRDPYIERPGHEHYAAPAPEWARGLQVSCSS